MHKIDAPKRAFYLNHQKFVLDIDIKGKALRGFTELHVIPTTNSLSHVRINARQCEIHNVTVNGITTSYEYIDIIKNSLLAENTKDKNIFQYHELKRSYHTALYEAEEGELLIHIPEAIDIVQFQESEAPLTDDPNDAYNVMFEGRVMFTPLVIRVDFVVVNPKAGVNFILPDPQVNPYRFPHVYTCNETFPGQVRLWLPCIDRMHERCTWEMEYIVDQTLQDSSNDNGNEEEDSLEMVVVSSGELIEQTSHPIEPTKKIFHYILAVPSPAFSISFAAGPFEVVKLSSSDGQVEKSSEDATGKSTREIFMNTDDSEGTSGMFAFCLPGWIDETANSCEFLNKALEFYAQELGSYPYSSFKLVFVEDAPDITMYSATMTIASTHLLHGDDIIDQTYETRRHLSLALAKQWFGIHVVPKYGADLWLTVGLANYATSLLIKHLHGNNEYRFRLKKDIDKVCELDVDRPPLYNVNLSYPVDPDDYNFMQLKAPLVLFVLGKRMMKGGPSLGIHRAIPKVLVAAMSGELGSGNALSTNWFLKVCRKVSGVDNKPFAEQWIFGSGCPIFHFTYSFNRKKMVVEINMEQRSTNSNGLANKHSDRAMYPSTNLFTGHMTALIREADGTPYEHVLDIQDLSKKYEVQFNTKYKRIRRLTKRFQQRQAAAAAAEASVGAEEMPEAVMEDLEDVFGYGMDEKEKEEWRVVEWGEIDEESTASGTFEWIRLDSDLEWICVMQFEQPDYMWACQLLNDRDVVAQIEAIEALSNCPSPATSTSLMRTMMDPKCFYRIRMEGAFALAKCAIPQLDWIGLHHLFKIFQKRYCYASTSSDGEGEIAIVPKPNNFSSFTEYFVQKAIVAAFSTVKNSKGHTPIKIKQFLLELLRYNDNTGNQFSDNYYISALINALGNALIPSEKSNQSEQEGEKELFADAVQEIERYRTLDYLVPSYHNTVTISVMQVMMKLMMANLLPPNLKLFLGYTRYGNFLQVRLVAFEALLLLDGLRNSSIGYYIFKVIAHDPCHYVRYYLAKSLSEMLGVHIARASLSDHDSSEEMVFEEVGQPKAVSEKTSEDGFIHTPGLEAIHKEFSGREDLQNQVWKILTSDPMQDYRVFRYIFLFCELLYKPIDTIPKLKIKMPAAAPAEYRNDDSLRILGKGIEANKSGDKGDSTVSIRKESTKANHNISTGAALEDEDIEIEAGTVLSPIKPTSANKEDKKTKTTGILKLRKESKVTDSRKESRNKDTGKSSKSEVTVADVLVKIEPEEVSSATPTTIATSAQKTKQHLKETPQQELNMTISALRPDEMKICKRILRKMMAHKSAFYFLQPVDPIRDGCPTYFDLIKHPMDLGTVKLKLDEGNYHNLKEFEDDIRLMLNNCFIFNPVGSYVYNEGQELESVFEKEWSELNAQKLVGREPEFNMTIVESPVTKSKSLPLGKSDAESEPPKNEVEKSSKNLIPELQKCRSILKRIAQHKSAFEFLRPVDPIKQGIPTYFEIIKNPMDLGTINKKLKSGQYQTKYNFREDIELMLNNCFTFNTPGTFVYDQAKSLSEVFQREWENQFEKPTKSATTEPTSISIKTEPVSEPTVSHISDPSGKATIEMSQSVGLKASDSAMERDPKEIKTSNFTKPAPSIASPKSQSPMVRNLTPGTSKESNSISTPKTITSTKDSRNSLTTLPLQSPRRYSTSPAAKGAGKATNTMDEVSYKRCQKILKKLWSNPSSEPFQLPVDPIMLKIPTYTEIVKEPMDLKTVKEKLDREEYTSVRSFEKDIRQIFFNCFLFNQPGTWVFEEGKKMEAYFYELLDRDKPRRPILPEDKQNLLKLVQKMVKNKHSSLFREPVDWVTLQIPDYPRIIRYPMDLGTIKDKLENDQYRTWVDFERDVRLIFNNCFTFNPSGTYAHEESQYLENYFYERYQELISALKVIPDVSRTPSREPSIKREPEPEPVTMSPEQLKLCEKIYKRMSNNKNAIAFLEPVDPVAMGIPHYFDVIRNPMDFSTVYKKLKSGEYSTPAEFEADIRQIFKNCVTFNGPEHYYSQQAMILSKILDKEMLAFQNLKLTKKQSEGANNRKSSKQPKKETAVAAAVPVSSPAESSKVSISPSPKTLDRSTLKLCESVLAKIKTHPSFEPFRTPVDTKALGIPHYHKIVKHPMDFGTIENKLQSGKYQSIEQFLSDSKLVFENCYIFNIPGDAVYVMGQELQRAFEKACKKYNILDALESPTSERSAVKRGYPEEPDQSEHHGSRERKRKKEKKKHKHSGHREGLDKQDIEENNSDSENSRASVSQASSQPQVRLKIKLKH